MKDRSEIFEHNRVILCHFDTYSAASMFARFGASVMAPFPLPEGSSPVSSPSEASEKHDPEKVRQAILAQYGFVPEELVIAEGFQEWMGGENGPIRIHLAKFMTFDPPREALEPHGALLKPISEMRGMPMIELNLLRAAFNLVMSGG